MRTTATQPKERSFFFYKLAIGLCGFCFVLPWFFFSCAVCVFHYFFFFGICSCLSLAHISIYYRLFLCAFADTKSFRSQRTTKLPHDMHNHTKCKHPLNQIHPSSAMIFVHFNGESTTLYRIKSFLSHFFPSSNRKRRKIRLLGSQKGHIKCEAQHFW